MKNQCNTILRRMRQDGYTVVDNCNGWTDREMAQFISNYGEQYLHKKK